MRHAIVAWELEGQIFFFKLQHPYTRKYNKNFKIPYLYSFVIKIFKQQAEVT